VPAAGEAPRLSHDGRFWLVNLAPGEGRQHGDDRPAPGGLLALSWVCPHRGCAIAWRPDFAWQDGDDAPRRVGWFACPCCGAVFTKAGVRIFGPAPRSMDTMEIDVGAGGRITVQSGKRRNGDADNPSRAVAWSPPPLSPGAGGAHTGGSDAIQP
jgi:cytochrome b6-f complex iron-sulfur subunit